MTKEIQEISQKRIDKALAGTKSAIQILKEAGVPTEDHWSMLPIIFEYLVEDVSRRSPLNSSSAESRLVAESSITEDTVDEGAIFETISRETAVPIAALETVLQYDEERFRVAAPTSLLGKSITEQARTVATLITVANRLGLGEINTDFHEIRASCEAKACYDMRNFAYKHMRNIPGFVVRGEGMNRKLSARSDGIKHFSTLVESIYEASRSNG